MSASPEVKILRGLPGSGKTTFANRLKDELKGTVAVSADDFRMVDGKYTFSKTDNAHDRCFKKCLDCIITGCIALVVDNTNTSPLEIAPYYRLAEAFNYKVEIVYLYCSPLTAFKRTTHQVPFKTLLAMAHRLQEPLPSYWQEQIIVTEEQ